MLSERRSELSCRRDAGEHLNRSERKELRRLDGLHDALEKVRREAAERGDDVHILAFDPHAFGGDGRMIVSIGHDPYRADAVSWHVPGYSTTINSLGTNLDNAVRHLESVRAENPDARVSSAVWIGYDAPQGLRGLWDVIHTKLAAAGGDILHGDLSAFNAARDVIAGDGSHFANNDVFAHSYGSTTTAFAGHDGRLADQVRSITLAGSPGAGPLRHASDFGVEHVFAASSSRDPVTMAGGRTADVAGRFFGRGLGIDPAMQAFGAHRVTAEFPVGMDHVLSTASTHTAYYHYDRSGARSESLGNFGRIGAGHFDAVQTEGHRTVDDRPRWIPGWRTDEPAAGRPVHGDGDTATPGGAERRFWDPRWHSGYDESAQNEHGDRGNRDHGDDGPSVHRDADEVSAHQRSDSDGEQRRCAHDANDILTALTGREAHLPTEPGPNGTPARDLYEARGSATHLTTLDGVYRHLLEGGDGTTAVLSSKWAGEGDIGGHVWIARNENGTVHVYERVGDRVVRSGWPPQWPGHAIERTAAGYFDRHGNALDPLTGRAGELHAADSIGEVAGRRRLESDGPAHPARIIDRQTGQVVTVPRSEHTNDYSAGNHPEFPGRSVVETVRTVGRSIARFIQIGGETAQVTAVLREVYENVERPYLEKKLTKLLSRFGYQGGHLIAFRFMLDQHGINMFEQVKHFNDPVFKVMENEWATWIRNGASVEVRIDLQPPGTKPDRVIVNYDVIDKNGRYVYHARTEFDNQPNQTFRRLPTTEIMHRLELAELLQQGLLPPIADPVGAGHPHDVGENWFRGRDDPGGIDPNYGSPLPGHWNFQHDPLDPTRINPAVGNLVRDPAALLGRDADGNPALPDWECVVGSAGLG